MAASGSAEAAIVLPADLQLTDNAGRQRARVYLSGLRGVCLLYEGRYRRDEELCKVLDGAQDLGHCVGPCKLLA